MLGIFHCPLHNHGTQRLQEMDLLLRLPI